MAAKRDQALALYKQAHALLRQANELATSACISQSPYTFTPDRDDMRYIGGDSERFIENTRKKLDRNCWRHAFETTCVHKAFDSERADEFDEQLRDDPPEFSAEAAHSTLLATVARSGEMFIETVNSLFSRLERSFKTHEGAGFGKNIIFKGVYGFRGLSTIDKDAMRDLDRVFHILDKKDIPERYGGIIGTLQAEVGTCSSPPRSAGEADTPYFRIKWFKNGNVHITILDDDLLAKLNSVLREGQVNGLADR